MKISEAIEKLQYYKEVAGNVDLVMVTEVDGMFIIEDRELEILDIPLEDREDSETERVVGFMEPYDFIRPWRRS